VALTSTEVLLPINEIVQTLEDRVSIVDSKNLSKQLKPCMPCCKTCGDEFAPCILTSGFLYNQP